jgi:hypothetical protein
MHLDSLNTYTPTSLMYHFVLPNGDLKRYVLLLVSWMAKAEMVKAVWIMTWWSIQKAVELEENVN